MAEKSNQRRGYQVPLAYTGMFGKLTIDLGESSISPEAIEQMMEALARQRDRCPSREWISICSCKTRAVRSERTAQSM